MPGKPIDSQGSESTMTRRRLLSVAASCLATVSCVEPSPRSGMGRQPIDLDAFMRLSRLLTGFQDLDDQTGRTYLAALLADPLQAGQLAMLWRVVGLGYPADQGDGRVVAGADGPLADTITRYWYSGVYVDESGEPVVATYVDALAWRALGYRSTGPNACGGIFGHWADPPPGV